MDHFYQQKLINEKNELQRQLAVAQKQLSELASVAQQYEQLFEALLNESNYEDVSQIDEGSTRRLGRVAAAAGEAEHLHKQFTSGRVAAGMEFHGLNPQSPAHAAAIQQGEQEAAKRALNLRTAQQTASKRIGKSLSRRQVRRSAIQGARGGKKNPQLERVAQPMTMGADIKPGESPNINQFMAAAGTLGGKVGKRVLRSAATREARKQAMIAGQREVAAEAHAAGLGNDVGEYIRRKRAKAAAEAAAQSGSSAGQSPRAG